MDQDPVLKKKRGGDRALRIVRNGLFTQEERSAAYLKKKGEKFRMPTTRSSTARGRPASPSLGSLDAVKAPKKKPPNLLSSWKSENFEPKASIWSYRKQKRTGRGEFATVFQLDKELVLKIVKFSDLDAANSFGHEMEKHVRFQDELQLPVPLLKEYAYTSEEGRCVMERLPTIYGVKYPARVVAYEEDYKYIRRKGRPAPCPLPNGTIEAPWEIQLAVVRALEEFVNKGVSHNDLHVHNIGLDSTGQVKFFDFGFSTEFPPSSPRLMRNSILAYHLYQIIELNPKCLAENSLYYKVIYDIRQGLYKGSQKIKAVRETE